MGDAKPEGKKLLGQSVEESRVKRLEKQQARYRDRGGTFVPSESNPLLDMLLARGVNGESPAKRRAGSRKSRSRSPVKRRGTETSADVGEGSQTANSALGGKSRKGTVGEQTVKPGLEFQRANSTRDASTRAARSGLPEAVAGSSKPARADQKRKGKRKQSEAKVPSGELPPDDDVPLRATKVIARPDHTTSRTKTFPPDAPVQKEIAASPKTQKRKGRVKRSPKKKAVPHTEEPPFKGIEQNLSAPNPTAASRSAATAQSRKRPAAVVDPADDVHEAGSRFQPPRARKRPRLPTPSDSEDDVPLVARGATVMEAVTHVPVVAESKRELPKPSPSQDMKGTRVRAAPGQNIKHHRGTAKRKDTGKARDIETLSPLVSALPDEHQEEAGALRNPRKLNQGAGKRKGDQRTAPTEKAHAPKRKKGQVLEVEPHDANPEEVAERPTTKLKPSSRLQKENNAAKKRNQARKPMPRLSMFPLPAMAAESDDELDLLR